MVAPNRWKIIMVITLGVFIVVFGSAVVLSVDYVDNCDQNTSLNPYYCLVMQEAGFFEEGNLGEPDNNVGSLSLSECSVETKLSVSPLNIEDYYVIAPLGNLNPPGHTLPTDHIYYYITRDDNRQMVEANIYAPGDIKITSLVYSIYFLDGVQQNIDYSITFAPCQTQELKFGHVRTINAQLLGFLNSSEGWCNEEYGLGPETYQQCGINLDFDVEAGTILGTAGGFDFGSWALDLWAWDYNSSPLQYASSLRYSQFDNDLPFHVICPLDLFTDEVRTEQESKLGVLNGNRRTIEPICGEVMQDVSGTAQGNWFFGEDLTDLSKWDQHLAFVHDNFDPSISVISIGGTIMDSGTWFFAAENTGTVNRQFSDVSPDEQTYCYDSTANLGYSGFPGYLIIKLLSATEMLVEHGNGNCETNMDFVNPTTYRR